MSEKCECPYNEDIIRNKQSVENMERVLLKGNGKPSIQESVIRLTLVTENLEKNDKELKEQLVTLTTSVNALTKAYSENIGAKEVRTEIRADRKWKITAIIAAFGVIATWIKMIFFE